MSAAKRVFWLSPIACLALACGDDPAPGPDDSLPAGVHVLPSVDSPFLTLPLTLSGDTSEARVALFSAGQDDLTIAAACLRPVGALPESGSACAAGTLEGSPLELAAYAGTVVPSGDLLPVDVSFSPVGRGVSTALLVIESDAENLPQLVFQIFAPAAVGPLAAAPDLETAESAVEAVSTGAGDYAFVRLFNLGGAMAQVTGLALDNTVFALADVAPSAECAPAACGAAPAAGCEPLRLGSGDFLVVPVESTGSGSAALSVTSDDGAGCPLEILLSDS